MAWRGAYDATIATAISRYSVVLEDVTVTRPVDDLGYQPFAPDKQPPRNCDRKRPPEPTTAILLEEHEHLCAMVSRRPSSKGYFAPRYTCYSGNWRRVSRPPASISSWVTPDDRPDVKCQTVLSFLTNKMRLKQTSGNFHIGGQTALMISAAASPEQCLRCRRPQRSPFFLPFLNGQQHEVSVPLPPEATSIESVSEPKKFAPLGPGPFSTDFDLSNPSHPTGNTPPSTSYSSGAMSSRSAA